MEQKVDKLKDSLVFIFDKLENMEKQVRKQEQEIENYIKKNRSIDFNELVAAHLKSTKTSIELLREEIEELQQLITLLFKEIKKQP
jgi:cell fate regulator YaaT (PSP1 superfamily)